MKKAKEIILSISIAAFSMLAGAACYRQVLAADKPVREVAPVQQQKEGNDHVRQKDDRQG